MDQGWESDEFASWIESRRLIISQLSAMDGSIRDLAVKIDKFNDSAREKAIDVAREAQSGIADLNLRVAMLELRAKMWGAVIGLCSGCVGTVLVQLVLRAMHAST
jgi:hypothetical protein